MYLPIYLHVCTHSPRDLHQEQNIHLVSQSMCTYPHEVQVCTQNYSCRNEAVSVDSLPLKEYRRLVGLACLRVLNFFIITSSLKYHTVLAQAVLDSSLIHVEERVLILHMMRSCRFYDDVKNLTLCIVDINNIIMNSILVFYHYY